MTRLEHVWQDARLGVRAIRREPVLSAVVIAILALAVAANTAIYSVIDAVMFRPLRYKDPERLVVVSRGISDPRAVGTVAAVHFDEWRRSATSFENLSLLAGPTLSVSGDGEPENVPGAKVSANLFATLGIALQMGRPFTQDEEVRRESVAILSDEIWRRRFAARPEAVGETVTINGVAHVIVGVLPAGFSMPLLRPGSGSHRAQLWLPMDPAPFERDPRSPVFNYTAIGRLTPGVSLSEASDELAGLQRRLAKLSLSGRESPVALRPLGHQVAMGYRSGLLVLWAAVATVLLITCLNVANLLLARAVKRRREIAVRVALGATRARILSQLLVESVTLSGVSGAIGVAAAFALLRVILAVAPGDLPRVDEIRIDLRVLLFTTAIVLANAVLFGVGPAWWTSRSEPQEAMRVDSRTASGGRGARRLRSVLVSVEVGLSVVAVVVGALLLRSFQEILHVERGFQSADVVSVTVGLPTTRYPGPKRAAFLQTAAEEMQRIRGVIAVGASNVVPVAGDTGPGLSLTRDGASEAAATVWLRSVNGEYFGTLGIPFQAGRPFVRQDATRPVAVVSRLAAERAWPGEPSIGKRFRLGPQTSQLFQIVFEVVGVSGDVRGASLTADFAETVYLPYWQDLSFINNWSFLVKTRGAGPDPSAVEGFIVPQVRAVLRGLDQELPIPSFRTLDSIVAGSLDQRRFQTILIVIFGAAGLVLAGLGLYGIVSYEITKRTTEIGIRIALGARTGIIHWLVVRQALGPLVVGVLLGAAASVGAERLIRGLLFGVQVGDPWTTAGVITVISGITLAACYGPARRATRIDPVQALRCD
jgi:putative ABC transport system permease protein